MERVVIIGASGHAKVIADIIAKNGDEVVGFLDDNADQPDTILGFPYLGTTDNMEHYAESYCFVIGIGSNEIRNKIAKAHNVKWYTAIHPSAQIALGVTVGEGTVVMANAVINADARVGKHCIINTGAVVEHDNRIGDYVHLSPNSTLCGTVTVGEMTHIGAGATVKNNISICSNVVVGAGGIVVNNIIKSGTYVGIPVKRM